MVNGLKNILVKDHKSNKEFSLTPQAFNTSCKYPENALWEKIGYDNPTDVLPCWYVDEDERKDAMQNRRKFKENLSPLCYFKIANRIDNTFIEGYLGHNQLDKNYHGEVLNNTTYFIAYEKREPVYFSFDQVSLYRLVEIHKEDPLKFILKRIDDPKYSKKDTAFMIMPFHEKELESFYYNQIKKTLKDELNITIYRADDFQDNDVIIETIYRQIEDSEIILADITYNNKNAFYELGYASGIGKEIITLQNRREEEKLFFDRAHIRSIMYDFDNPDKFRFELINTIKSIRARN